MALSSVSEGFVLLRNLWEYNSILKYRYKKRKAYKVATMRHLPAPQAKEYKPNLAVRVFKDIFSHFRDGLQGAGSLFSGKSPVGRKYDDWYRANGWTKQESHTQIPSSWNPPPPKKFKFNVGDKVLLVDGSVVEIVKREITKGRESHIRYSYKGSNGNTWNCVEDFIKCIYVDNNLNQAVNEKRKLMYVKYIGDDGHYALTKGRIYKVESYSTFNDGSQYIKIIGNEPPSSITPLWCFSLYQKDGVPNDIKRFELIYDNYENNI